MDLLLDSLGKSRYSPGEWAAAILKGNRILSDKDRELVARALTPSDWELARRLLARKDKNMLCAEFGVDRGYLRALVHRMRHALKAALLETKGPSTP